MWRHARRHWGRRGWLRPWIIGTLRTSPKNGAEIIDQIEQMTLGWRPSPGSVYPLLDELSQDGLIRRREDGRFEITDKGRNTIAGPWELFAHEAPTVEGIVAEMRANVAYLEDLGRSAPTKLSEQLPALREMGERLVKIAGKR